MPPITMLSNSRADQHQLTSVSILKGKPGAVHLHLTALGRHNVANLTTE